MADQDQERDAARVLGQIDLLQQLLDEGMHAAAGLNVARLEQLVGQQESALRALAQRLPLAEFTEIRNSAKHLRRSASVYSHILLNASRTVGALSVARQATPESADAGGVS